MKNVRLFKLTASMALAATMGACTNSSSPEDDFFEFTSSSKGDSSSSSVDVSACKTVKESLATPTKFNVANDSDSSWTFSWEYTRNSDRPETGFRIEYLDLDATNTDWKSEGTTNAEVTLYKLQGKSKVGKYYRVVAIDDCGKSDGSNRLQINENGSTSVSTATDADLGVPTNFAITDTLGENLWLVSWTYSGDKDSYVLQRFIESKNAWEKFLTIDDRTALETVIDTAAAGKYIRVAAVYEGKVSTYSDKIKMPNAVVKSSTTSSNPSGGGKSSCVPAAPTNLKAMRIAPSVWRLSWDYKRTSTCNESGFMVQSLDMKKPVGWKDLGESAVDVKLFNLDGAKFRGMSFRVSAKNGDKMSEWTDPVEVTTETKYSTEYNFVTPTLKASVYKVAGGFEMMLVVDKNFPNEAMVSSSYTESLKYEFRWGGSAPEKMDTITVDKTSVTMKFTDKEKLCSSFGQVRTIWKDSNKNTDVSEWSDPVGSLTVYSNGLTDAEKLCPYVYKDESSSSSAE